MNEEITSAPVKHDISLRERKQLIMQGVLHVDHFNESEITLQTNMGLMLLKGKGLHITQLNLETGDIEAEGFFSSIHYVENKVKNKGKNLLSRILK